MKKNRYSCRWFFNSYFSINVMFVVRFLRNLNLGNGEDILSFDKTRSFPPRKSCLPSQEMN